MVEYVFYELGKIFFYKCTCLPKDILIKKNLDENKKENVSQKRKRRSRTLKKSFQGSLLHKFS